MKITILLNQPYPYGMALTNRVHLYAKRFHDLGHDVEIVIPKQTESHKTSVRNTQMKGEYEGVKFTYPMTPLRSTSFVMRRINDVLTYFITLGHILKTRRGSDIFLTTGVGLHLVLTYKLFCVFNKCKFVAERSEFPFVFSKGKGISKIYQKLYIKYVFRVYDGMIVISQSLMEYFEKIKKKEAVLILVPILTDTKLFPVTKFNSNEIVYTGTLNQFKDGILDLLNAFLTFSKRVPGKKLVLMGDVNMSPEKDKIYAFIRENSLQDSVEVTGYVGRPVMIERMCNAAVLVLAKPASLQADHCFPTKIAEYLSTGKPVLTTDTGSISQYLTDRQDAFLTRPNDPLNLAKNLEDIFSNYKEAEVIGENGRKIAQQHFESTTQGDRLLEFFEEIVNI